MNDIYTEMRNKVFTLKPEDVGVSLNNNDQVYASVVDINVNGNIVTLICAFDGTVSLYYSNGKCDVGLGKNEKINQAAISFLVSSGQCIKAMQKATQYPVGEKNMQIYLFVKDGIYQKTILNNKAEEKEARFLNFLVQNVLTAIREFK